MAIYPYSFTLPPVNKQDIPSNGVPGEFLGISAGGVLDWLPVSGGSGTGDLLAANNLSELTPTAGTARTNLGLGTGDSPTFANLTLTSPSLSSSAPVTISQTWDAVGQTFKALVVNAAGTSDANSASGSLLADFQTGGVSQFRVTKTGRAILPAGSSSAPSLCFVDTDNGFYKLSLGVGYSTSSNTSVFTASYNGALGMLQDMFLGWSTAQFSQPGWDVRLYKDGAGQLALRNGTAAQTFNVYGTSSSSNSVYERMFAKYNSTNVAFQIGTETAGATLRPLEFVTGGGRRMVVTAEGNVGVGDIDPATRYPATPFEIIKSTALSGPILTLRSNLLTVGSWSSIAFGSQSDLTTYRKAAIIFEVTEGLNQGKIHIALNNSSAGANAAPADARLTVSHTGQIGIGTRNPTANLQVFQPTTGNGTISISAGGTTVTGSRTQFLNTFKVGDTITSAGQTLTISAIASDTSMTTSAAGALISGQPYTLVGGTRMSVLGNGNVGIGTTSPTSKLHVVGDAVLTGDLLGTNYTIGVPTILTQSNISITNNHSGVSDSAIVITPKGVGAFIVGPKPDGTVTGGNARGNYSVDLQIARLAASQVCSGIASFIGAGQSNTITSNFSSIPGGQSNSITNSHCFVGGGQNNTASQPYSFVLGGVAALSNRYALSAHAAGQFSSQGDAQKTTAVFRNKTTTNSAVELFLDGASARYTVTSGKIISMLINITGTKSDGSAVAHYVRQYSIKNIGGTTSEVYAAVTVGTDNAAGTSIALSANDTNDALKIEVTGVASETWRWVASVDAVEVGHGV